MTPETVLKEESDYSKLKEKVDDLLYEIAEMETNGGCGNQRTVCRYLLNYASTIGLEL